MAIYKTGDENPVINYVDLANDETTVCASCGRDLIVIAMDENHNRLVCEICDFDVDEGIGESE